MTRAITHQDEIQVGTPLERETIRDTKTGILATCYDHRCQWQGLFPDGEIARGAAETHAERAHYGPSSYGLVALLDGTRAQCLEPGRDRLTAVQSREPTFPRTTGDVSELVSRGDLIALPPDREQMVVGVRETRSLGLPTWSVRICDPDVDLVDDDPDWRGLNEQIARDGDVYTRYGEQYLGAPSFEIRGTADHQADLSSFGSDDDRLRADGGRVQSVADMHQCQQCDGSGTITQLGGVKDEFDGDVPDLCDLETNEVDCPRCDGRGEEYAAPGCPRCGSSIDGDMLLPSGSRKQSCYDCGWSEVVG